MSTINMSSLSCEVSIVMVRPSQPPPADGFALHATLPPDCATSLAMADSPAVYRNPRPSVSLASTLFSGIHAGSALGIVLQEEALRLGRFGVLTVIQPLKEQEPWDGEF